MQDKKSFGKYILEKRKEANLTQEELAQKLYVIPSTVSKWERGITYPDVAVIVNLCKELNISEHEFFTACDDETKNKEKKEIRKYRAIKKWSFLILNISYLVGILVCLICNLVLDHKLSWFFIVLIGVLISFTITSIPFTLKKNRYKILKITIIITILVYLLLFITNHVTHGNWLFEGYLIASFVFLFLWIDVLICTFAKMEVSCKIAISLWILAFVTAFTNQFCAKVLEIPNNDSNIPNILCSIIMIVISLVILLKKYRNKRNHEKK